MTHSISFAPLALVALHVLTCSPGAAGLLLQSPVGANIVNQLVNRTVAGDVNATLIWQPHPRLPLECKECVAQKTGEAVQCSQMNTGCACCKAILEHKKWLLCKDFEKRLGKPYTDHNGTLCMDTIQAALNQRTEFCIDEYKYDTPMQDITPKRFGDMCNGTQPVGCGSDMCSKYGCNGRLQAVEAEYRDVAHYKKVYDEHPCRVAERRNLRKVNKAKEAEAGQAEHAGGVPVDNEEAKAALEKASAETAKAVKHANDKAEAEHLAEKKRAVADAALKFANHEKEASENTAKDYAAREEKAARRAAEVQAALVYARAEKAAADRALEEKTVAAKMAAEKAAVAKLAHEKAAAETEAAQTVAKEKAVAENDARKAAGGQAAAGEVDPNDPDEMARKANEKYEQRKAEDRAMAEDAFGWASRRRRSDLDLRLRAAQPAQRK